jgi:Ca-activated chloride channel family protein
MILMKPKNSPFTLSVRRAMIFALTVLLAVWNGLTVTAQSGRNSQTDKNEKRPVKVKPVPPPLLKGGIPDRPQVPAEDTRDTIRINSDLVTIVSSISSTEGKKVEALSREDFEVYEDGVKQELSDFRRDADIPLRMVMLFDTSSSVTARINFERRAAVKFFEKVMREKDQSALFSFSDEIAVLQDFTSNVSLLSRAAKQLKAKGATSLYDGISLASDYLKPASGRHVIVIVSDGGDTTSARTLLESLASAQQADAVIFAVYTGTTSASLNVRDLAAERALEKLTAETGGEVYRPNLRLGLSDDDLDDISIRELDDVFERLADQLRTQYTLGFYSSNEKRDGRFRQLTVKVKKPGYAVKARSGYYAPKS